MEPTKSELYLAALSMVDAASNENADEVAVISDQYSGYHSELYGNVINIAAGLLNFHNEKDKEDILKLLRERHYGK